VRRLFGLRLIMPEKENLTPMLKQYADIKAEYPGFVLFYRLGDFYEMFFDEAKEISKELELTLTARAGVPMCGLPYHAAEGYIQKLIKKGYKIALCEQIESPDGKGPMTRKVTRLITPGTLIEDSMLDESRNNYIGSFCAGGDGSNCGIAFGDLSTGSLGICVADGESGVIDEIARFMPSEAIFNAEFLNFKNAGVFMKNKARCLAEIAEESDFTPDKVYIEQLLNGGVNLNEFPELENPLAVGALCALLRYCEYALKSDKAAFTLTSAGKSADFMEIGLTASRNLELTENARSRDKKNTLLGVLDRAKTAMGRRRLRQLITRPYRNHLTIVKRLDAVEELTQNAPILAQIRDELSGVFDFERLMSRVIYGKAAPRDICALGAACARIPAVKNLLGTFNKPLLRELNGGMDALTETSALIANALVAEPPVSVKDGGYISGGFNPELDRLRELADGGANTLSEIEKRERAETGIKNLRVGYNRVFGYYIEVSKSYAGAVPERYRRKQTLAGGERYVTEELKKIEEDILSAKEKIVALEQEILAEVRAFVTGECEKIRRTSEAVADLDLLCSLAEVAVRENYRRPEITLESVIELKDSRHPVVEKTLSGGEFAPNDCYLDTKDSRLAIITGPNMSGKSTYMRQVALIAIMAQMGSFVPAQKARIGVADKLFTRVGATDDLASGHSTFMVEMLEVAEILASATKQSLVILDEIGRGTSTFDGISIAKAVAEHINAKIGCRTLFATHYHELIELEKLNTGIKNLSVGAVKKGDQITFLHKIVEGGTDDSYGIEVAKLAGLPESVVREAKKALRRMEMNSKIEMEQQLREEEESGGQVNFALIARDNAVNRLKLLNLNDLTPIEALKQLEALQKLLL